VAIAIDDPAFADYTEAAQLPSHVTLELRRFFQDYKVLEGKLSEVDELYDRNRALQVIREAMLAYRALGGWDKP
jgi:inorganic pyrophosphatase